MNNPAFVRKNINNISFYLPFIYNYNVRLGTIWKFFSWIFIFIVPTLYYLLLNHHNFEALLPYFFLLITVWNIYEIGYIQNDTETILKENKGSLRLYPNNLQYYYDNRNKILIFRYSISFIFSIGVIIFNNNIYGALCALAFAWMIPIVYFVYNRVRSRKVIYIHFFLVNLRYFSFLMLDFPSIHIKYLLLLFITFPLINWTERFTVPRYNFYFIKHIIPSIESLTYSRISYYLIASIIVSILYYTKNVNFIDIILIYIFFIYRLLIGILVRFKRPTNYLLMK